MTDTLGRDRLPDNIIDRQEALDRRIAQLEERLRVGLEETERLRVFQALVIEGTTTIEGELQQMNDIGLPTGYVLRRVRGVDRLEFVQVEQVEEVEA